MSKKKNKKLVPNLRFKGFTDDWIQEKLSNLYNFSNGINTLKENYGHGRKMISVMDILSKDYLLYENVINYVNVGLPEEESFKVEANDLVFVRSSETKDEVGWAKTYRDTNYSLYSGFVIRGKVYGHVNSFFVENTLNYKQRRQIQALANGSTRYNISQQTLNSIKIALPQFEEQNRISTLLEKIDSIITLEQEKLMYYKEIKLLLLLHIFNSEQDSNYLRFNSTKNKWFKIKLEDLYSLGGSGGTPRATNKEYYENGTIPFLGIADLTAQNGQIYNAEKSITQLGLENSSASIVPKGSITVSMYASYGKVGKFHIDAATSQAFFNMSFDDELTADYTYYYLEYMEKTNRWDRLISEGTQKNLNAKKIKEQKIIIPDSVNEIQKIVKTLRNIDSIISIQNNRIKNVINVKKHFMENVFL